MPSTGTSARWRAQAFFQWLGEGSRQSLPGYCAFCLTPIGGGDRWCYACHVEMPWNRIACRQCAEPLATPTPTGANRVCGRCLKTPPPIEAAFVPLLYESRLTLLVQRFKFSADPLAGELLVSLLAAACREAAPALEAFPDMTGHGDARPVIVGVPGQRARTRERGFDHVAWLTRRLASRLHLPVRPAVRRRETPTQLGLDRRERQRNVKDAFAISAPLPPLVIVLDDVMTTGATLNSLALACQRANAQRIMGLAFARTPSGRI